MTSILVRDPVLSMKRIGSLDFSSLATTPAEDLEAQRIQGAAIFQQMQEQDVAAAQTRAQGYATPEGSSFEVLGGPKRGGPLTEPTGGGVGLMWVLGGLGLMFLLRGMR